MTAYMFPGQGSQKLGMGEEVFPFFPELVQQADDVLGYSIVDLCLNDPHELLNNTAYTQPALYVVNALTYLKKLNDTNGKKPEYFLGHSLGEYNALWASGAFDFQTGLKLVQKRGSLMSQVPGGGMAAVIGLSSAQVTSILEKNNLTNLSIANFNAHLQQVISGPNEALDQAKFYFTEAKAKLFYILPVKGAFHSPLMEQARLEFTQFLANFSFAPLEVPVLANLNALPYEDINVTTTLAMQIDHPVQWLQSIRYLLNLNESQFEEIGPGTVLSSLVMRILSGK